MRILIKAEFPVETSNEAIRDGGIVKTFQSFIEDLKPEATYFMASHGKRTALFFVDMKESSQIPEFCEPFFLAMNAHVELTPVMRYEDLKKAGPAIENAVMKYGSER